MLSRIPVFFVKKKDIKTSPRKNNELYFIIMGYCTYTKGGRVVTPPSEKRWNVSKLEKVLATEKFSDFIYNWYIGYDFCKVNTNEQGRFRDRYGSYNKRFFLSLRPHNEKCGGTHTIVSQLKTILKRAAKRGVKINGRIFYEGELFEEDNGILAVTDNILKHYKTAYTPVDFCFKDFHCAEEEEEQSEEEAQNAEKEQHNEEEENVDAEKIVEF